MTDIKAIEWLKQIRDKYIHGGDAWFDEQRCRAIEYAIECIYKRNKWIPVSEQLPEQYETVIGWTKYKEMGEVSHNGKRFVWEDDSGDYAHVTHWMPLPEPPKED